MFVTEKAIGEARFKTADELNLPEHIYTALLRVQEALISGKITEARFNMSVWDTPTACGSICCIGGWMDFFGKCDTLGFISWALEDERHVKAGKAALYFLTHPPVRSFQWDQITIKDAIKAIDNFLTTGDSSWKIVRSDLFG